MWLATVIKNRKILHPFFFLSFFLSTRTPFSMTDMVDAKRLKATTNEPKKPKHSKIFQPFRAIGYVTNDVPYVINQLGQDYFLTTCVGTSFQTYNVSHPLL
jgi:hypothetical protein